MSSENTKQEAPDDGATWTEVARAFGIPRPLVKATRDPFEYAIGLRDGTTFYFERAEFDEDPFTGKQPRFVTLVGVNTHTVRAHKESDERPYQFSFERGICIRLEEIVWAADAPYGS